MRSLFTAGAVLGVLAIVVPGLWAAPDPADRGLSRRALVISIHNYLYFQPVNPGLDNRNSRSVFTLIDRHLPLGLSIPRTQITQLSDAARAQPIPPLKPVIEKTLTDFLETSRARDRIIVLFVGHAVETKDDAFLVPIEGEWDHPETLISLKWLYEQLAACKAQQKLLILDVCRFNPSRGLELPGSGPVLRDDDQPEGVMGLKLDTMLREPPAGVQVWSACVRGQHSIEFDDASLNNGVFLQALSDVLVQRFGDDLKPEAPIPVADLAERVAERMKALLKPLGQTQTSRLSGKAAEKPVTTDTEEKEPPRLEIKRPHLDREHASVRTIRDILAEVAVPPLRTSSVVWLPRAEALPPFSAKVLADYEPDEKRSPFRDAVRKAQQALTIAVHGLDGKGGIREVFMMPTDQEAFHKQLRDYQLSVGVMMANLAKALEDLKEAGQAGREAETNKRWQANYDYILARLELQLAFLYEYQTLLGSARKSPPDYDPKVHNAWRIASIPKLQGDREGQKLAKHAVKILYHMTEDYTGTPWAVLAKRDLLRPLGLELRPVKFSD